MGLLWLRRSEFPARQSLKQCVLPLLPFSHMQWTSALPAEFIPSMCIPGNAQGQQRPWTTKKLVLLSFGLNLSLQNNLAPCISWGLGDMGLGISFLSTSEQVYGRMLPLVWWVTLRVTRYAREDEKRICLFPHLHLTMAVLATEVASWAKNSMHRMWRRGLRNLVRDWDWRLSEHVLTICSGLWFSECRQPLCPYLG